MKTGIGYFLAVLLAGALLFSGCQKKTGEDAAQSRAADPNRYAVTEPITIEWWHALESQNAALAEEIVSKFNASQNLITVEARYMGSYGEVNAALVAAHAAGTGLPAITVANTPYVAEYGAGGLTEDLKPYIQATNFDIGDFGDGLIAATAYENEQAALPFLISTQVIYYNVDMAKSMGVRIPEKWNDMEAFLKAASKRSGGQTDLWAFIVPGWDQWYFETFYLNNGVKIINPDGVSTDLDSPKAIEIAQKFKDWCDAGYMYWASGTNASNIMRQNFWDGKAFAVSHTSSLLTTYEDNCPFEVGMVWLPGQDTKKSEIGGSVILIPSKADQKTKNAGWRFMEYLVSGEVNMMVTRQTGYMPLRKSALNTADGQAFVAEKPAFKVIFDNLDEINPRIQHQGWSQLANIWMAYMAETILENRDVPEQMKKMAAEINEVLGDL